MAKYPEYLGKTVNKMVSEDAIEIKDRVTEIMSARNDARSYAPVSMYKDMEAYAQAVHERQNPYTEDEIPEDMRIQEGYTIPINEKIRIKAEQGAKIIHPLLGICDKGDLTFVVANELIPVYFDKDKLDSFLDQLELETSTEEGIYENESSCRSACTGLCVGTCFNTCDGCSESCDNICTGCGACTGECSHLCGDTCDNTCKADCVESCGAGCLGCSGDCEGGCHIVCHAACGGGCTLACSHTCKAGVGHKTYKGD